MELRYKQMDDRILGCVEIPDLLLDLEIVYLNPNCPEEKVVDVFLHEVAHIIQMKKHKKLLRAFCEIKGLREMMKDHDKEFWKIFNKIKGGRKWK